MSPAVRGAVIGGVAASQHRPSSNQHMGIGITMFAIICTLLLIGGFGFMVYSAIKDFTDGDFAMAGVHVIGALLLLSMILFIFGV